MSAPTAAASTVEAVDEKRAASPSPSPAKEEDGAGDAAVDVKADKKSARPERTATFRDYTVKPLSDLSKL